MNKKHLYISIIFGVIFAGAIVMTYLTSANFLKPPEIILPEDEVLEEINYRNNFIITEVNINEENVLEVLENLERPLNYSYNVIKRVFSDGVSKISTSDVYVDATKTTVIEGNKVTEILEDTVYITKESNTLVFDRADFTKTEIIGIPDYNEIKDITKAGIIEIENTRYIEIISEKDDIINSYYIDLTYGLLTSVRTTQNDYVISEVAISEILVN